MLCAVTAVAQTASDSCKPSPIIPLASGQQPLPKIVIDPPLAEPQMDHSLHSLEKQQFMAISPFPIINFDLVRRP